jgi:hypothetical protein
MSAEYQRAQRQCARDLENVLKEHEPELTAAPTDTSAAASTLGRRGGQSTSEAKRAAVRENGKKGGRPKKNTVTPKDG